VTEQPEPVYEIAPRDVISDPVRRWGPVHWKAAGLLLPAVAVAAAGLIAPFGWTIVTSLTAGRGPGNYGSVLGDPAVRHAIGDSVLWVLFALLVCVTGLAAAWPGRRRRWRAAVAALTAPVAVSALVAAVAFRILFTPSPGSLGPGSIQLVLMLAFAWQWVGLAVIVFRAGLAGVPADLLRVARAFGAGPVRRARAVVLPALLPVASLLAIIVLVAAARVFELVLAAAPGSVQDQVDTVGVHFWRFQSALGDGESSALAVLYSVFVALVALAGLWGLSREWPAGRVRAGQGTGTTGRSADNGNRGRAASWAGRTAVVVTALAWTVPLAVVVATSFHDPAAAATGHWWAGGWGLSSYAQAFGDGQLLPALAATGVRALCAAAIVTVLAVPAAYALAWGRLPRVATRTAVGVATVLSVLPPQAVAIPLAAGLGRFRLLGADVPLTGVYAAFWLPLAVLLLRGAFASVPRTVVRARQLEPSPGAGLIAVAARCAPALLAVAVLQFVFVWNDLLIGLLLGGTEAGQATLVLFEQTREFATSAGPLAAGAVVITVVPLALVLGCGKWLVRGLAEGTRR
jgi:alpha-glucoside transport system permease protein